MHLRFLDLLLAVAVPLSTQLAAVTGRGRPEAERAREAEGPLTPPAGAFVIWAPIFAGLAAYGNRGRGKAPSLTRPYGQRDGVPDVDVVTGPV